MKTNKFKDEIVTFTKFLLLAILALTLFAGCTTIRKSLDSIIEGKLSISGQQIAHLNLGPREGSGNGSFDRFPA